MSKITQQDRYKKRYARIIKQLSTLAGYDVLLRDVRFVVVPRSDGVVYRVETRVLGAHDTYEGVLYVRDDNNYTGDALSVIGREVCKRLRERICNARAALR